MAEITFEQIETFCRMIDKLIVKNMEGCELCVLMSLDMERELKRKAPYFFDRSCDPVRFKGCRVIKVITDGYLSAAWEVIDVL